MAWVILKVRAQGLGPMVVLPAVPAMEEKVALLVTILEVRYMVPYLPL